MRLRLRRSSIAPWAGIFGGALAWFLHHQIASNAVYFDCRSGGPLLTAGLGLIFGLAAAASGLVSWRARRAPPSSVDRPESRDFAGAMGAMGAAVFAFAILLQSASGLVVPGCFR